MALLNRYARNEIENAVDTDFHANSNCPDLKLVARGKVRDLYEVDEKSLLFVATDRISAFDVIMKNVSVWILKPTVYRPREGGLLAKKGGSGIMHASSPLHPLSY